MLFRLEALEAQREKSRGAVVLTRPLSFTTLTTGAVAAAVALVALFFFAEYTKRTRIIGFTQLSAAAVSEKQEEIIDQQARLQALERSRLQLVRESSQVTAELDQIPLKADRERAQLERSVSALDQDLALAEAQRQMLVTAPADGVVTGILVEPGQHVSTASLATLLPDNATLEAVLFAPSRAAGFIEPGQAVRLRYQAYPYQKFGQHEGTVLQVSKSALTPNELPHLIAGELLKPEAMYRVTVRLASQAITAYGQPQALTAGMQLEADVMQDRRKLIEWVFEPLYSLRGKW